MVKYAGRHVAARGGAGRRATVTAIILIIVLFMVWGWIIIRSDLICGEKEEKDGDFLPVPMIPTVLTREESLSRIEEYALLSDDAEFLLDNAEAFSDAELMSAANNPEKLGFIAHLHTEDFIPDEEQLTAEELKAECPMLLQWDQRWGYQRYGSGTIGMTGCAPTCMSMVITALTDTTAASPDTLARWSESNGYYVADRGTEWTYITAQAAEYGLMAEEVPLWKESMEKALRNGSLLVCAVGPGHFTTEGHYIVISGFDEDGFIVNDPNCLYRSALRWKYEEIEGEIRNIWSVSIH